MLRKQLSKFNEIMLGIERIYEDYAKSAGLTYMSLTVLSILYNSETPCTQKHISTMSHYNKQVVNAIIKGFHENGFVEFQTVPEDRRNKYILFTKSGSKFADEVMRPLMAVEERAISTLSDDERSMMLEMLERCYRGYAGEAEEN